MFDVNLFVKTWYFLNCYADFKSLNLPCGTTFTLSVRDELFDMEAVSQTFEEDKDTINEVNHQFRNGDDAILISKLYPLAKKDEYNLYCKIDFQQDINLRQSVPEIIDVAETCSLDNHVGLNSLLKS